MATYEVRQGAGGAGSSLPTLAAAGRLAKAGDTVIVHPGTYREVLTPAAGTTWRAAQPGTVILDGGYHPGLMAGGKMPPPDGYLPGREHGALLTMSGEGATVEGFIIRNAGGRGATIAASDCSLRECVIDHCYGGGVIVTTTPGKTIRNVLVERNVITRLAMNLYDNTRQGVGEGVSGSVNFIQAEDCVFRGNVVAFGNGEGVNIGRGSKRVLVADCVIHTCHHLCLYFNRTQGSTARGNRLYHTLDERFEGRPGAYPAAVVFGDERQQGAPMDRAHNGRDNTFERNVVVGLGTLLSVRNNTARNGYDTQLLNTVIRGNTFVGGPGTDAGIVIQANPHGRAHENSVFEENVIHFEHARAGADMARGDTTGVTFRRNAWSRKPPAAFGGAGDVRGDLMLARADAPVNGEYPDPTTTFKVDNYRPRALSPIIGAGAKGATLGALAAVSEPVDEPPPPQADETKIPLPESVLSSLSPAGVRI